MGLISIFRWCPILLISLVTDERICRSQSRADSSRSRAHVAYRSSGRRWLQQSSVVSNFEVGSLNFFRGEAIEKYFEWLDKGGGFYYERFGDAPVHTLSVAMFLSKSEILCFRDIGYQLNINHHCPPNSADRCFCEPSSLDESFYKLVPIESPQRKPQDTCIRQFIGSKWLDKVDGCTREGEEAYRRGG